MTSQTTQQTSVKINEDTEIVADLEAIEPKDYFKVLKSSELTQTEENIQKSLAVIADQIHLAQKVGQKNFLRKLAFTGDVLIKEQTLLAHGYSRYMIAENVKTYIDKVNPKDSVKIIELERYPRAIPQENLEKIVHVQSLRLFDKFLVVFTDFTDQSYKTPEEKKQVDRNRDPIVFGVFYDKSTGFKYNRFYFITDWEDEYCHLTFNKMIDEMKQSGIQAPDKVIATDYSYLQELVKNLLTETEEVQDRHSFPHITQREYNPGGKTIWERMKWLLTGK